MKRFLITYTYRPEAGPAEEWHRCVAEFISALDNDPGLSRRITYRCMKARDGLAYFHLAEGADDEAIKALQQREYFKRYTEETKRVAGGVVEVLPLETIAETEPAR
jgi:quinol monooxygenase YgiN